MTAAPSVYPSVFMLPGRDRRLRSGHPWVYSNEIRMSAEALALEPGAPTVLNRVDGKGLGVGTFNPHALIAFRLFSTEAGAVLDAAFVEARLRRALALRERLFAEPFYRLVHGEADGLPGLVADRFGGALVVQVTTAGMEKLLPDVLAAAGEVLAPETVVLRNDTPARRAEGLDPYVRLASGELDGAVVVRDGILKFFADLMDGQKTGWFFDQRDNRAFMAAQAGGARMLDVYCHSGAFAIAGAAAGASGVVAIDSSEAALELARRAAAENGVDGRCVFERGEAFAALESLGQAGERFAVVVADPPAFAKSRGELKSGLKGYRKLARLAARLVEPGGFLFLASCSHNVEAGAFAQEVGRGMASAGRAGRIIRGAGAGADHPVHPFLPESAYLKTLVLQLD